MHEDDTVNRLTGQTAGGDSVEAAISVSINVLGVTHKLPEGSYLAYRADKLRVSKPSAPTPVRYRYGIVNFRFFGTHAFSEFDDSGYLLRHRRPLVLQLSHPAGPMTVHIERVVGYSKVELKVSTLGETAVTCEAVIDVTALPSGVAPDDLVNDLCLLLSVARGTWVQWVYRRETDSDEGDAAITHVNHITRRYQGPPVLDPRAGRRGHTKRFLEGAFAALPAADATFDLRRGLVQAYVDGRSHEDALEMRGVKLAVVAEMIKARYLGQAQHVPGEKFPPFGKALRAACAAAGYVPSSAIRRDFVKSRNRLVHAGRFRSDPINRHDSRFRAPDEEYFFMVSFLDRFFLKLLGYTGPYLEWAKYPNHEHGDLE